MRSAKRAGPTVVRAQADDDRRGRDLRQGGAQHLEALRRGATRAGVPRDLAAAEHGDEEGPHPHGERVAEHEHGALRRAAAGHAKATTPATSSETIPAIRKRLRIAHALDR